MHILVVDADIATAHWIEEHLKDKKHRVSICTRGMRGLDVTLQEPVDLVILDAVLPDMSGLELCRRIRSRSRSPHVPILFFSSRSSTEDRIAGLEAGADDYMAKATGDLRELALRIEVLLRWSHEVSRLRQMGDLNVGGLSLCTKTFRAEVDGREVSLTPVEFELLRYLMMRAGQVVSAEQLLQDVWRYYPGTGDPAVVRVQVMNLRSKLEKDRTSPRYIKTVYRHGYMVAD